MEVIYRLIPGMIIVGLILVGILIWAVRRGQYDDLDGDAHRILLDDDEEKLPEEMRKQRRKGKERPAARNWPDADGED